MLQTQWQPLHPHILLSKIPPFSFSHSVNFPLKSFNHNSLSFRHAQQQSVTTFATAPEDGPVELSSSIPSIFATDDNPTLLQTATSVLLTGAISIFLFRSLRRRAKRVKEMQFRSTGVKKSLKDEAMESLKAVTLSPVNAKSPPSPVQTFLGAVTAAVISVILYKFTTTIEASLNRQAMPANFSVRQITVTIRTIINGICYLATFVFGINSLGLFLYSGQLAFNSFMEEGFSGENEEPISSSNSNVDDSDSSKISNATEDQNSDNKQ